MGYTNMPQSTIVTNYATMIFKKIAPYPAFFGGKKLAVSQISVSSIYDNLVNSVTFKYTLLTEGGVYAGEGTHTLNGENYAQWDGSHEGACCIVSNAIGVEIQEEI